MVKRLIALFLCLILAQLGPSVAWADTPVSEDYLLGYGDVLHINLLEQPSLINLGQASENITIRPDGKINLPLVGDVQAAGLTVVQLNAVLTRSYEKFFKSPHLTINIATYRRPPIRIVIYGRVTKSGPLDFDKPPTLIDAVALAGGFLERADRENIRIYNKERGGTIKVINIDQILRDKRFDDIILNNGDMIEVPREGSVDFFQITPILLGVASVIISIISLTRTR